MEKKSSHGPLREKRKFVEVPAWVKKEKEEMNPIEKEKEILCKLEEEMRITEDQLFPIGSNLITLPDGVTNIEEYEKKLSKRHAELEKLIPLQEEKIRSMENIKNLTNNASEN